MYYLGLIFILNLFVLTEYDRLHYPIYNFIEYYSDIQSIIIGLLNSLFKIYNNNYIYDHNKLALHKLLQCNHKKLMQEFSDVYLYNKLTNPGVFQSDFREPDDNNYGYYFIKYYGDINQDKFPLLSKLIQNKDVYCCFYSVINDEKYIKVHRGPYSGILRYHYTLFSDNTECDYLQVLDKKLYWKEKDGFLFDDTFAHNLTKTSSGTRVSIIIDIKKQLPWILDKLNTLYLNYVKTSHYVSKIYPRLKIQRQNKKLTIY